MLNMPRAHFSAFLTTMLAAAFYASPAAARDIQVQPGQSIQAAVDQAAPGDRILVFPATYHEAGRPCPGSPAQLCAVSVTQDDISLIALSDSTHAVVLENAGGQDNGIFFAKPGATGAQCLPQLAYRCKPQQNGTGRALQGKNIPELRLEIGAGQGRWVL